MARRTGRRSGTIDAVEGLERLELPDLESFTDDEILMSRVAVVIVRAGGAMYTGRYLECVVAGLLGAHFPRFGVSPWDLVLPDGTRIEVKSGTKCFTLGMGKDVHVWVFVHKSSDGLAFSVATSAEVAALEGMTVSCSRIRDVFGLLAADKLLEAVRAASQRSVLR